MAIFQQHVNLTPKGKKWLENIAFSKQVANAHPGGSGAFTPELVNHMRFAEHTNETVASFVKDGLNGGHVTAGIRNFASDIDPTWNLAKVKTIEIGSATVTTPGGGSYTIRKFEQQILDPSTGSYITSSKVKTTFDDESRMTTAMSDIFENSVRPNLPAVATTNFRINEPLSGAIMVRGFVNYDPGAVPPIKIATMYIEGTTF
jgi:hypothetical protein